MTCNQSVSSDCLFKWKSNNHSQISLFCLFFKKVEENNSTNNTNFILLSSSMCNWYQLRNGDIFYIPRLEQLTGEVPMYTYDIMSGSYVQYKTFNIQQRCTIQIRKIGDLMYCQESSQFYLLYVNRNFIKQIYETQNYFDMIYIENSDEEYIILTQNNYIDITHYNFSQGNVVQMQTYNIEKIKLLLIDQNENNFLINPMLAQTLQFNLVDALKVKFEIRLNGILDFENIKFYVTVTINTLNQSFETKIIRTFRSLDSIEKIIFIDERFAIFQGQAQFQCYIYDLRQDQEFYDPIVKMNMQPAMIIKSYNSTHYIFFDCLKNEAFLIEIGYEISFFEKEKPKNCKLIAENEISKAEIQLIIQQEEINDNINYKSIIIVSIIICILIVLIIFILRRQQLKNHNLKQFQQISIDESKLQ
ncbi:unnamed protein product (macronuclear) [Paramecium tetraurelia]|uniref:Transmembrane protein n=1 Tax=Paramecium tetraurelia TaxID=5888 RepID=A0C8E4_PARTE|nr:uncharacterized protein GSPATT00036194001 [Paramecium tetraurelia]CAK67061.1 unnamed protein product [Paramecium tetraurelia]|eukprot:XP_001434458.1 hypothetical protein (macronuclear) [Paramecium tetraurelia strain d4-2]